MRRNYTLDLDICNFKSTQAGFSLMDSELRIDTNMTIGVNYTHNYMTKVMITILLLLIFHIWAEIYHHCLFVECMFHSLFIFMVIMMILWTITTFTSPLWHLWWLIFLSSNLLCSALSNTMRVHMVCWLLFFWEIYVHCCISWNMSSFRILWPPWVFMYKFIS